MDSGKIVIDSDMTYPILFIPKMCTTLSTNFELTDNVYIDVNITSLDTENKEAKIYKGFCNIKLVDSYGVNVNQVETPGSSTEEAGIEQTPVTETNQLHPHYSQSKVWIDPSRSPYVYNTCDPSTQEQYSIRESGGLITVEQHNTCITKNVYCKESNESNYTEGLQSPVKDFEFKPHRNVQEIGSTAHMDANFSYYEEDEFECGVFLSQLPEEIMNETQSRARQEKKAVPQENSALKQLMSSDIQSKSKQRKTILFLGNDSHSGHTIQKISYNDPLVSCADMEVDNKVDVLSKLRMKKYQCDKCKQMFDQIASFRQHIQSHSNKEFSFVCSDCGKTLKSQSKFEQHCMGHGDPDFECLKCSKVFASKFTLRVHMKIHNRKHACSYCKKSYGSFKEQRAHMEKTHLLYMCRDENCPFVSVRPMELNNHLHWKTTEVTEPEQEVDDPLEEFDLKSEDGKFGSRSNQEASGDFSRPNQELAQSDNLAGSKRDLSRSSREFVRSNEDLKESMDIERERIRQADSVIAKTCNVCLKKFSRIDDLKRHLIEHIIRSTIAKSPITTTQNLKITCEVCQIETFNKIAKYKEHLREHAKLTIYRCTFCDKSFSDSSNFSKHKKIHGVAHFLCDLCNRKFNSKKMITQHMEQHIRTSPVQCTYCDKMFHFESMLKKHVRCAHRKEIAKKFTCKFCIGVFNSLKEKWDHEWDIHKVRKIIVDCLYCGSKFRKYSELKRHCSVEHNIDVPRAKKLRKISFRTCK